jgi:hypothetical protein
MWMLNIAISIENDVLNHQFVINQDGDIMGISWVNRIYMGYKWDINGMDWDWDG